MNSKLFKTGIGLVGAAVVSLIFAVVMEIQTQEPVYFLIMKVGAGLFGVGGPIIGIGIVRRRK